VGTIKGYIVNDTISIRNDTKFQASHVEFLSIIYAKDLSTIISDGLLGLSPLRKKYNNGYKQHHLINQLKNSGVISKAVFAIYLTDTTGKSKV
jgi:hypothetical protein